MSAHLETVEILPVHITSLANLLSVELDKYICVKLASQSTINNRHSMSS